MNEIRYLLSIKELLEGSSAGHLEECACAKLDRERLRKMKAIKSDSKRFESLGAGLLLQLGIQETSGGAAGFRNLGNGGKRDAGSMHYQDLQQEKMALRFLTVSEAIELLAEPVEPQYIYGKKGKPYFYDIPFYFNLSHSGEYVFCAFSEQEIGVDIQYRRPLAKDRVVLRFFTEAERTFYEQLTAKEEREKYFYRLWTRKEAYGKLTGEGIMAAVSAEVDNTEGGLSGIFWEEYEIPDAYQVAVCKGTLERE